LQIVNAVVPVSAARLRGAHSGQDAANARLMLGHVVMAAFAMLILAGLSLLVFHPSLSLSPGTESTVAAEYVGSPQALLRVSHDQSLASASSSLQGPLSSALGRTERGYRVRGLVAHNTAQGFSAQFGRAGVAIASAGARFELGLEAFGRAGSLRTLASVRPSSSYNRVTYAHGALQEWWANGPLGLEQGFDLAKRPAGAGSLLLSISVPAGARMSHGSLLLPGGLRYAGLTATGAHGRALPARLYLDGRRLLVEVNDRGARYPVRIDPFVQKAELHSAAGQRGQTGISVGISGNTAVVGAHETEVNGNVEAGAVYVFTAGSAGWSDMTQTAELTASDGAEFHQLGYSVAISGNTIVAGAPGNKQEQGSKGCGVVEPGAAYVYVMPEGGWKNMTQTSELSEDEAETHCLGAAIGYSVAIEGDTVVTGAPYLKAEASEPPQGAALVYEMPKAGWASQPSMKPTAELKAAGGGDDAALGSSVAISAGEIVAGAPTQEEKGGYAGPGAAYVYVRPEAGWKSGNQNAELRIDNNGGGDEVGYSVAIVGDSVAVGAPNHEANEASGHGAIEIFTMPAGGWKDMIAQTAELTSTGQVAEQLGWSLATSGETIVAGTDAAGTASVFTMPAGGWTNMTQTDSVSETEQSHGDFGWSVAIDGSTIVVGAPTHTGGGAAFVFEPGSTSTGSSGGATTTPPTTITTPPPPPVPVAHVGSVTGSHGKLTLTASCPAGGASCSSVLVTATVTEHVKDHKVVAVSAAHAHSKRVSVGSASVTLVAGSAKKIAITLNATGRKLLAKFGKLEVLVTVTSQGKTLEKAIVRLKAVPAKKKK